MENILNQDTVNLLKECNAGCKMAIESLEQLREYARSEGLQQIIKKGLDDHIKLEEKTHRLLNEAGKQDKEVNPMVKAFSWLQSEFKLSMDTGEHQVASIITDGCNKGIKTLTESENKYANADGEARRYCEDLKQIESKMVEDVGKFL